MAAVLFRVDAGPGIGLGHLQRSTALAAALAARGVEAGVLAPPFDVVRARVTMAGCELVPLGVELDSLGNDVDLQRTLDVIASRRADMVVVDSYRIGEAFLEAIRRAGARLIVFDDRSGGPTPADVLINGAVGADAHAYRSRNGQTLFLLGPGYAVLQRPFRHLPEHPARDAAARVLIAVGGADPHELLRRLVEWIDELEEPFEIDAVIGPFAQRPSGSPAHRHRTRLLDAPDGLHAFLGACHLVVCGAGQTLYEAAASGTPAIAIQLFDNQQSTYAGFVAAGAAVGAGAVGAGDLRGRVIERTRELLRDAAARDALGNAGRRLVDGRGAERVADRLLMER